jgi:hypothetical protein
MILAALLAAVLGGCVATPVGYYDRGYSDRGYARGPYYSHDRDHSSYYYRGGYGGGYGYGYGGSGSN